MAEEGYFKKGVYYPPHKEPITDTLTIKIGIEGYEEEKAKLKALIIDADLIRSATDRFIPPSQQRLEV